MRRQTSTGSNELCPWRRPVVIPQATYERLEIVQRFLSVAEGTLKRSLQTDEHRREYVQHILDTVRSHVAPGQKALLVCKLDIVDARPEIEGWSANVRPFLTAKQPRVLLGVRGSPSVAHMVGRLRRRC